MTPIYNLFLTEQVLDQAVELDEAQRDASDACLLRQQLADSRAAEAAARQALAALRQQAQQAAGSGAASVASGGGDGQASPARSSGSSARGGGGDDASPPRSSGQGAGAAALQGRVDGLARELAATKQEVRWRG